MWRVHRDDDTFYDSMLHVGKLRSDFTITFAIVHDDRLSIAEIRKVAWPRDCTLILACSDSAYVDTTSKQHAHCQAHPSSPTDTALRAF